MKKKVRKLSLSRETLSGLDSRQLDGLAAGIAPGPTVPPCNTADMSCYASVCCPVSFNPPC